MLEGMVVVKVLTQEWPNPVDGLEALKWQVGLELSQLEKWQCKLETHQGGQQEGSPSIMQTRQHRSGTYQ